ncbi:hypothetical protein MLD38_029006 [Melastoma candidum]|uniref:Uncharacterized protein n=1 Tax=Melastoma candidum TaxID=119954 RepID=A0ACB9N2N9_9MYRT|nr:hypothetical protein MLD38_029006 [Melastoma candidum]
MSRRLPVSSRHLADGGNIHSAGSLRAKTRSFLVLYGGLLVGGTMLLIIHSLQGSDTPIIDRDAASKFEGDGASCTPEVIKALPVLNKVYGNGMHKVLHVGPDSCSVVAEILKEEDAEAWGVEPYDLDDAGANCKRFVRKGIVRVANIKFPLPYQARSFSTVLVSDVPDYLSTRYLNKTIPEFARVAAHGVVIFTGMPSHERAKVADLSRFGRPAKLRSSSWWVRFLIQGGLEENESAKTKFELASRTESYNPGCQVFHLKSRDNNNDIAQF